MKIGDLRRNFGQDTICDFPFGCQNCECEPDGTDEAGRISAAGCPAEELTPTAANPDQSWWPGLRQIPQTVKHDRLQAPFVAGLRSHINGAVFQPEQAAANYAHGNPLEMNGPCARFSEAECAAASCEWVPESGACEVPRDDPHRLDLVWLAEAAATRNAVCLDGSAAAFYFRAGSGDGARKYYIHHQGGGWCTGPESCEMRSRSNLGTSAVFSETIRRSEAYFSRDPQTNMMHDWNVVFRRIVILSRFACCPSR